MFDLDLLMWLIPAMPLAAALVIAALGKRVLGRRSHVPAVAALAASCALSVLLLLGVERGSRMAAADHSTKPRPIGFERTLPLWTWTSIEQESRREGTVENPPFPPGEGRGEGALGHTVADRDGAPRQDHASGTDGQVSSHSPLTPALSRRERGTSFRIDVTLRADPLSAVMLVMVTFVSLLVAIYSIGYMHDDPGYWRFFTYVSLFVFSMTMLVSVSNFVMLYVFWEAVGLCSYLLIGFWFEKPEAAAAGMKAFLVNRIGDFGFALGLLLLWITYGTFNFHDAQGSPPGILGQTMLRHPAMYVGGSVGTAICLLLFLGACGKSAQFPLHVWLPDAMEGPTPVSALIHAATMVTAGVYMVARCTPLFAASPQAQVVVASVGGFTAILAAVIAVAQTDLKRILAYSTISQLGYMFLGLGTGTALGISAGMFHLVTHAFFKALLFLGAGSVMHAMGGVIDIRQFGGLRRRLPTTHWTFLFGCLALAGILPFAGFWSKDAILAAVWQRTAGGQSPEVFNLLYLAALVASLLTALYAFRALFLTFYGELRVPKEALGHAHESPSTMTVPLAILAVCALAAGGYFQWTGDFLGPHGFLARTPSLAYLQTSADAEQETFHFSVAVAATVVAAMGVAVAALLYLGRPGRLKATASAMELLGLYGLARGKFFLDPLYGLLVVRPLEGLAAVCAWFDRRVIDTAVNLVGMLPGAIGAALRPLQSGMVQFYALVMMLGLLILIGLLVVM